jgi:hypothetical protein
MTEGQDSPSSHRALVTIASEAPDTRPHGTVKRPSIFLAQLIANARSAPQSRQRRRADPSEAIAAYQSTVQRIRNLNAIKAK